MWTENSISCYIKAFNNNNHNIDKGTKKKTNYRVLILYARYLFPTHEFSKRTPNWCRSWNDSLKMSQHSLPRKIWPHFFAVHFSFTFSHFKSSYLIFLFILKFIHLFTHTYTHTHSLFLFVSFVFCVFVRFFSFDSFIILHTRLLLLCLIH
jgi:hypothetical protein